MRAIICRTVNLYVLIKIQVFLASCIADYLSGRRITESKFIGITLASTLLQLNAYFAMKSYMIENNSMLIKFIFNKYSCSYNEK